MRSLFRLLGPYVAVLLAVVAAVAAGTGRASAHNTFESSDPADGAVAAAPARISMVFTQSVPLDTATVQVIDASGARTEVTGLAHGPSGDNVLVAPLPPLAPGQVTVRWRLVGPDGHPLTDRIVFVVTAPTTPPAAPASTGSTPADAAAMAPPVTTAPALAPIPAGAPPGGDDAGFSTPDLLRWLLRYGSYLAMMVVVGIVLTDRLVWPGLAARPIFRTAVTRSLVAVAALGLLQLAVLASDISGRAPWSSWGSLDTAIDTGAGMALCVRALIAGGVWLLLFGLDVTDDEVRWVGVSLAGLGLLGTWAWAGHSATQRWPELGVPLDVAHHAAAALWIGALAITGLYTIHRVGGATLGAVMLRLSRVAAVSVGVLAITGLVQSLRLVGSPWRLFDVRHGMLLALKLVLLAAMLSLGAVNRRRVHADIARPERTNVGLIARMRQSILVEFGVGLAIIAVTAAMVVSPPATSGSIAPDGGDVADSRP